MKQRNGNLISEKDFEFYRIPVPWKLVNLGFLKQDRRKIFVKGELEKLHPGFSDKDCTDIKFSLKKRKIVAEVAVMNRLRLTQYKNIAGGKMLLISGKLTGTRTAFSEKPKNRRFLIFIVSAIVAGGLLIDFSYFRLKKHRENPEIEGRTEMLKENIFEKTTEILKAVENEGGIIKSLRAENGTVEFKIAKCWPENIFSSEFCAVSYENGIPNFSIASKAFFLNEKGYETRESSIDIRHSGNFISLVRKSVLDLSGKIHAEEQFSDFSEISFTATEENISKILFAIRKCEIEGGWCESNFNISAENGNFAVTIGFEPGFLEDSFCIIVSEHKQVFEKRKTNPERKVNAVAPRQTQIKSVSELAPSKKVGQISGANGRNIIFLRTQEGKIIRKEVENGKVN